MAARSLLAVALAALASVCDGCAGRVVEGLPLDAGDDETTIDNTTVVVDSGRGPNLGAGSSGLDGGSRDAGRNMDAGLDTGTSPRPAEPSGDAGAASEPGSSRDLGTDKSKFMGESRCGAAGALLCDDFESEEAGAAPDSAIWSTSLGYVPSIDAARAARGTKSLHFQVQAGAPGHIEETTTFPAASDTLYGRMFVWFGTLPTGPDAAKWAVVAGLPAAGAEVRVGGQFFASDGNRNLWGVSSTGGDRGEWFRRDRDAQGQPKTGEWICLEWLFTGSSDEMRVWIDAVEQPSLHTTGTDYLEGDEMGQVFNISKLTRLRVGWAAYAADTAPSPVDVWIDEIALDVERIGCVL